MKSLLFKKLNKSGFDKITKNLVEFVTKEHGSTFDDVYLHFDLTHDQILIICQIGSDFFRIDGMFPKQNRDDYGNFMGDLEITVNNILSIPQKKDIDLGTAINGTKTIEDDMFLKIVEDD